jgi:hypothetical protein
MIADLAECLPPPARQHLRKLIDRKDDQLALRRAAYERTQELRKEIVRLETSREIVDKGASPQEAPDLNSFIVDERRPTGLKLRFWQGATIKPPSRDLIDVELAQIDRQIAALREDLQRVEAKHTLADASCQRTAGLINAIGIWLEGLPAGVMLTEVKPNVGSKHITPELIEERRRRIRELVADLRQIDAAPYTSQCAKEAWRAHVSALAERGRPRMDHLIDRLDLTESPWSLIGVQTNYGPNAEIVDPMSVIAWLNRDHLIAAGEAEIDASADDSVALTDQQRRERFREVLNDLLAAEREEEAMIRAAHFDIDRRPDADPRAVLCLGDNLPAPQRSLSHAALAA